MAEYEKSSNEQPPLPNRVAVDVNIPREETDRYYAETKKTNRLQWWTFIVSLLTLLAVAWYASIARGQLNTTRENFQREQRPYIWLIHPMRQSPSTVPGSTLAILPLFEFRPADPVPSETYVSWNFSYQNFGKSAANKIRLGVEVDVGKDALNKRPIVASRGQPPLPPGLDDSRIVYSNVSVTQPDFNRMMNVDGEIVVRGLFEYTDSSGQPHQTRFCFLRLGSNTAVYCPDPDENYIK